MKFLHYKRIPAILVLAVLFGMSAFNISSAKIVDVNVSNYKFTPKDITISEGDTVRWTCTQGTHDIDGTKSVYPNNPESFSTPQGSNWVYMFVFTIPGIYNYQCDPHANFGMIGSVTVESVAGVNDALAANNNLLSIYPNPAFEIVTVSGLQGGMDANSVRIFNNLGESVMPAGVIGYSLNITNLPAGVYFLVIGNRTASFTKMK